MAFAAMLDRRSATKMSILLATYGFGALVSPLVATQFASIPRWSFHFLVSLGISLLNLVSLTVVFEMKDMKGLIVLCLNTTFCLSYI